MNRNTFALLGSIVVATAGVAITTAASAQADKYPKVGQSPTNPASPQILGEQPVGSQLKQEDLQALPFVLNAVRQNVSGRTGKPTSEFSIVEAKQQTWSNGCLGLGQSGVACTQGKIPGWQVTVASGENRWVYRTNISGTLIKLDEAASSRAIALGARDANAQTSKPPSTGQAQPSTPARGQSTRQQKPPLRPILLPGQVSLRNSPPSRASTGQSTRQQQIPVRPSSPSPNPLPRLTSQPPATEVGNNQVERISFTDIPAKHWAKDFIAELADKQIIKGSNSRFRPDDLVTRGELAAMLSLAFKKPNIRDAVEFKDVTPDQWVHSYILEVYQRGFFDLEPGNVVNPDKNVTRLDVLVALAKGLNYSPGESPRKILQVFSDASAIPTQLLPLVAAATERGLVVNHPNIKLLNPNQLATRAEVAALIYQGMVSTGEAVGISSPYVVSARKAESLPRRNGN